jgi:probable HAF family extracellular repeat protein
MTRHMVCTVVSAIMATVGWSQSLTWLDTRFNPFTIPLGVSADGSVVVGYVGELSSAIPRVPLDASVGDTIPWHTGRQCEYCLRRLGERFCGGRLGARCKRAATRVPLDGWQRGWSDLGALGGDQSEARGVSADGSVVVGWAHNGAGERRAFRWTAADGDD